MNNLTKILIVVVLIIVVAVVIILKNQPAESEKDAEKSSGVKTVAVPLETTRDLILSGKTEGSEPETKSKEKETIKDEQAKTVKEEPEKVETEIPAETKKSGQSKQKQATGDVLAIVAGEEITAKELQDNFNELPRQYQDIFKNDKDLYLEQLIIKQLLVQKAIGKGYIPVGSNSQSQEEAGIQQLIAEISSEVDVPEAEIEEFYQQNKGQMQGATYEQVKNDIRNYLAQQKQGEIVEQYIDEIRLGADVVLNEDWIAKQIAAKPKNPLSEALQNGLPTVLDLGADNCVPCQMMKPIFAELEKELDGIANILLLEIADYRDISNKYNVRVIPTQIFFDQNGEQYWRHEGFLSKEDILKKLRETGVEL